MDCPCEKCDCSTINDCQENCSKDECRCDEACHIESDISAGVE